MEEGRSLSIKKKPRVVLDRRFHLRDDIKIGEKIQLLFNGIIISEKIEMDNDGVDRIIKKIKIQSAEEQKNKDTRIK